MNVVATILDVAKRANVSSATVSRVLNKSELVCSSTREKVLQAMADLNYQPNLFSRNLRRKESKMILILVNDLGNPFYGPILLGMDEMARKSDYNLFIVPTYGSNKRELGLLHHLESKMADGAIFMSPTLSKEQMDDLDNRFPIVQCCEYLEGSTAARVSIDNYAAAYQAIKYLHSTNNKKKIAFLCSSNNFISTQLRKKAYLQAMKDFNIGNDPRYLRLGSYSFDYGISATRELLKLDEPPTVYFAISDTVAAGCLQALITAGVKVPQDAVVMGFDNTELSKMVTPSLTTVAQPLELLGKTAIEMLLNKLNGKPINNEVILDHEIILRQST